MPGLDHHLSGGALVHRVIYGAPPQCFMGDKFDSEVLVRITCAPQRMTRIWNCGTRVFEGGLRKTLV